MESSGKEWSIAMDTGLVGTLFLGGAVSGLASRLGILSIKYGRELMVPLVVSGAVLEFVLSLLVL